MSDNPALKEEKPYKHTVKNERFCKLYVGECNGNGSAAARGAGYSEEAAKEIAYKLLTKGHIRRRIETIEQEALDAAEVSPEWVIQQLKKNALSAAEDNPGNHKRPSPIRAKRDWIYNRQSKDLDPMAK